MSLLKKALEAKTSKRTIKSYSEEEVELILAWTNDEVTLSQVGQAKGYSGANAYSFLANGLKFIINQETNGATNKTKKGTK